jgi:hypothetical protein
VALCTFSWQQIKLTSFVSRKKRKEKKDEEDGFLF